VVNVLLSDGVLLLHLPSASDPLFKLLHLVLRPKDFPLLWGHLGVVLSWRRVIPSLRGVLAGTRWVLVIVLMLVLQVNPFGS
jgi:hypothetical protein